jgi:alpha-D-ribose 1-methylphosphonate 5-triphosphate synthase subunit PhnL
MISKPPAKTLLEVEGAAKSFTLHAQGGVKIPVFRDVSLHVAAGEAVALSGHSGAGKSSLLRMLYGNYHCREGAIRVRHKDDWIDLAKADARTVLDVRRHTIGYISQFLRVVPRVPALDVVAEPVMARGASREVARKSAAELLARLRIPERLWSLSPVTFSGGEQQRVNVARGFAAPYPILLLDEPTASLDAANRATVIEMIAEARARRDGASAVVAIFHDDDVRAAVCGRAIDMQSFGWSN